MLKAMVDSPDALYQSEVIFTIGSTANIPSLSGFQETEPEIILGTNLSSEKEKAVLTLSLTLLLS